MVVTVLPRAGWLPGVSPASNAASAGVRADGCRAAAPSFPCEGPGFVVGSRAPGDGHVGYYLYLHTGRAGSGSLTHVGGILALNRGLPWIGLLLVRRPCLLLLVVG
jgi:hypothetical protein